MWMSSGCGNMQIAVVCLLLVRVMGPLPALAGLGTTLLLIPASSFVGRRLGKARKAVVGHTDARVKLTTEVCTASPLFSCSPSFALGWNKLISPPCFLFAALWV